MIMLQVAIGGAHRALEPRRNEDADRGQSIGMHVEEAEDLRLGKSEACATRCPAPVPSLRAARSPSSCPAPIRAACAIRHDQNARSSCRPTAPTGPSPTTVSAARTSIPGMKVRIRISLQIHSLIRQPNSDHTNHFSTSGAATGVPGQICTTPELINCSPTHWLNCPSPRTSPSCFCRNGGMYGSSSA